MAMFLNILNRWELAELNQEEAAELLGVSERTFRRWTRRYEEEGEAGLVDRRLGKASGRRVPADRAEEVERLYRERYQGFTVKHFHEHLVKDHGFGWGYTWLKLHLQWAGVVAEGAAQGGASAGSASGGRLPGMMLHQDGSRHEWLEGQRAARSDRDARRRDGGDLFGVSRRGGRHGLDLPGAQGGLFRARPADEPLYGPRLALFPHDQGRRDRPRLSDPGRPGARAIGRRAYRGLFPAGPRAARSGRSRRFRTGWSRNSGSPAITDGRGGQRLSSATSICPPTTPASPSIRPARARPSRPFRASISTRSCACRRSVRSGTTIACPTER